MTSVFYQHGRHAAFQDLGLEKTAEEPYEVRLQRRFAQLRKALSQYGEEVDTGHKRLLFPKRVLAKEDIENLGFTPVMAAIPEAGQSAFQSYRHPDHNYHIHEHFLHKMSNMTRFHSSCNLVVECAQLSIRLVGKLRNFRILLKFHQIVKVLLKYHQCTIHSL